MNIHFRCKQIETTRIGDTWRSYVPGRKTAFVEVRIPYRLATWLSRR